MARRSPSPGFIEALARGLDVLMAFQPRHPTMTLSAIAAEAKLARPTAHRILLTLAELGYVRAADGAFTLTPKVMELGTAFVQSMGLWDVARPHMEDLVAKTNESCSIVQLEGSDVVYVARVAVPKVVGLTVHIGTRFPALQTALGKVILADLSPDELTRALAVPSRSNVTPRWVPEAEERDALLARVREQGWALADEQLARGIRSVAVPLRDRSGHVIAALNVNTNAAETSMETLLDEYLPLLHAAAEAINRDWALMLSAPHVVAGASMPRGIAERD
jgi:IclR family pca regulon transcriptional regulator